MEAPTLAAQRGFRKGRDGGQHGVLGKGHLRGAQSGWEVGRADGVDSRKVTSRSNLKKEREK